MTIEIGKTSEEVFLPGDGRVGGVRQLLSQGKIAR
jgi:hypothetical protein